MRTSADRSHSPGRRAQQVSHIAGPAGRNCGRQHRLTIASRVPAVSGLLAAGSTRVHWTSNRHDPAGWS